MCCVKKTLHQRPEWHLKVKVMNAARCSHCFKRSRGAVFSSPTSPLSQVCLPHLPPTSSRLLPTLRKEIKMNIWSFPIHRQLLNSFQTDLQDEKMDSYIFWHAGLKFLDRPFVSYGLYVPKGELKGSIACFIYLNLLTVSMNNFL